MIYYVLSSLFTLLALTSNYLYFIPLLIILLTVKFEFKHLLLIISLILFFYSFEYYHQQTFYQQNDYITFTTTFNIKNKEDFKTDIINLKLQSFKINFTSANEIKPGETYSCQINAIKSITNMYNNPSSFNYINYMKSKKIFYELSLTNCDFKTLDNSIISSLTRTRYNLITKNNSKYKQAATINALSLGHKDFIEEQKQLFTINSIMHLITISGAHLIVVIKILDLILLKLRIPTNYANVIITVVLIIYTLLAGMQIAIIRATCMQIGKMLFPTINSSLLLSLIYFGFIIYNPFLVLNIGFILTFFISYILMYLNKNIILTTIVILILTFPLTINLTYEYNLFSFIVIILTTPIIGNLLLPLSLLCTLLTFLDYSIFKIDDIITLFYTFLNYITIKPAIIGHLSLFVIFVYYIICFYSFKYNHKYLFLLILLVLLPKLDFTNKVHFIDINQGKTAIITYAFGPTIVIDSGSEKHSNELVKYLKYLGKTTIDHYFITHDHEDHYGGTKLLQENFKIKNIYSSFPYQNSNILQCNDKLTINNDTYYILNPCKNYDNVNNESLVLYVKLGQNYFLFTGDIEKEIEEQLIATTKNLKVDILDVAHHGSKSSSTEQFINYIKPKEAVIQAGLNNKFNHPHNETISTFKKHKVRVFEVSKTGIKIYNF